MPLQPYKIPPDVLTGRSGGSRPRQLDLSDLLGEFELPGPEAPYQAPGGGTPGPTEITPPGQPDIYTAQLAAHRREQPRPPRPRPTETTPGRPPIYTAQAPSSGLAGLLDTPLSSWTKRPEDAMTYREMLQKASPVPPGTQPVQNPGTWPFPQLQEQFTKHGVSANRKLNELFK